MVYKIVSFILTDVLNLSRAAGKISDTEGIRCINTLHLLFHMVCFEIIGSWFFFVVFIHACECYYTIH